MQEEARGKLVKRAVEMAELCVLNDKGERDNYSTWFENCKAAHRFKKKKFRLNEWILCKLKLRRTRSS